MVSGSCTEDDVGMRHRSWPVLALLFWVLALGGALFVGTVAVTAQVVTALRSGTGGDELPVVLVPIAGALITAVGMITGPLIVLFLLRRSREPAAS
jgi:hypothetical protein